MNNEQYNQIIDEAYENFIDEVDSMWKKSDVGDLDDFIYDGLLISGTDENGEWFARIPTKEEFINKCKTDELFSKMWELKIEERELSLEERLKIADKFNPLIREDCLTKTHHPDETDELKLVYRHEWLDSLGPNVVPQRKLITITYKDKTIESYES